MILYWKCIKHNNHTELTKKGAYLQCHPPVALPQQSGLGHLVVEVAAEAAAGPPPLGQEAEGELALLLHLLGGVQAEARCLAQEQALGGLQEPGLERG